MNNQAVLVPGSRSRSSQKRELYKIIVALSDVTAALESTKILLTTVKDFGHPLYYPLFAAVVVCYGRPFSTNKPFGRLKKVWGVFKETRLQKTHDELLAMRNEIIAHSDMSVRRAQILPPSSRIANLQWPSKGIGWQVHHRYYGIGSFIDVRDTCLDLGGKLQKEVQKEIEELYGGMELPSAAFYLRFDEGL